MQSFWKIFCLYRSSHQYSVGRPKTFQNQSLFETAKYACKNVCLIKELRALPFNTNYNLNTCIECLPFLSIFSTRFRRDLLFYCFVPNRSISTVTVSLQTLVKCKNVPIKMLVIVSKMNITTSHVTLLLFSKRFCKSGKKKKKGKMHLGDFQKKKNMRTMEKSNLSSVMFVVFFTSS